MIISAARAIVNTGVCLERGSGFPHWTAGFLLAGSIKVVTAEGIHHIGQHGCVILPPHTPYELTVTKKQDQVWMIFDPREPFIEGFLLKGRTSEPFSVTFDDPETWAEVDTGLCDLLKWWEKQPPHLSLAENAMEKVLLLARWAHDQQNEIPADERIANVIEHMKQSLTEEMTIGSLSHIAALSPSRFAHLFRERMGVTPMNFLEARRMEQAKQILLTTDLPIQVIAMNIGFPNAQHFSTRFRKLTGQSPSAFRESPQQRFGELYPEEDSGIKTKDER